MFLCFLCLRLISQPLPFVFSAPRGVLAPRLGITHLLDEDIQQGLESNQGQDDYFLWQLIYYVMSYLVWRKHFFGIKQLLGPKHKAFLYICIWLRTLHH